MKSAFNVGDLVQLNYSKHIGIVIRRWVSWKESIASLSLSHQMGSRQDQHLGTRSKFNISSKS